MKYLIKLLVFFISLNSVAQEGIVLDKVIGVVGNEIATKSELEAKYSAFISQGMPINDNTRCEILEDILYSKMLLNQAKLDSVEVSDSQVESELDRRLRYYIAQFGSEEELEAYYKKPLVKLKDDLRESLKETMLMQSMQGNIASDISVTPEEVKNYYKSIPEDSLPLVNAEVEIAQIVINASTSMKSINAVKEKLREYKKRVGEGEKFSTLAVLYSEDQGSAVKGGEIGFVGKAEVEPEFSAAAFKLKAGNVSPIVKTRFGYHIIQMIERRGTKVNVRHILLKPKQDASSFEKAKVKLDSIASLIEKDSITFEFAAKKYSDDDETKKNGGIIVNQFTAASMTAMDDLDPSLFFVIDKMEVNEISQPVRVQDPRKSPGYRIIKVNKRTTPHRASLERDYQRIKSAALAEREQEVLQNWMSEAVERTYIKLDEEFTKGCDFIQPWIKNNN